MKQENHNTEDEKMKIEIRDDEGTLRGCVGGGSRYGGLLGPVVGIVEVDGRAYVYPGTETERINSLCDRAVVAYAAGRKTIRA